MVIELVPENKTSIRGLFRKISKGGVVKSMSEDILGERMILKG